MLSRLFAIVAAFGLLSGAAQACPPQSLLAFSSPVAVASTAVTQQTVMVPQQVQSTVMVPQTVTSTVMVPQTVTTAVSTPVVVPPTVVAAPVVAAPVCARVGLFGRLFGGRSVSKTTVRTSGSAVGLLY